MAVPSCLAARSWRCLDQPEKHRGYGTLAKLSVVWLFGGWTPCTSVGLLTLPRVFPAGSRHFGDRTSSGCCRGLDRVFTGRPIVFSLDTLCESPLEKRISSCQNRGFRWQGAS